MMPAAALDAFEREFFRRYFEFHPGSATYEGLHQYDTLLADMSGSALDERRRWAAGQLAVLEGMPIAGLDPDRRVDAELLRAALKGELYSLDQSRWHARDPAYYDGLAAGSFITLAKREFAPKVVRRSLVTARLRQVPSLFEAARENLTEMPAELACLGIEQLRATRGFFARSLPTAFSGVDGAGTAEFSAALEAALAAYDEMLAWLAERRDGTGGTFRIGAEAFADFLRESEMVEIPLDRLLEVGWTELRRLQEEFDEVARRVDSGRDPHDLFAEMAARHPAAETLLDATRATLEELRAFCVERGIVDIPSEMRCGVDETPEFMRALTFASMDTPGPYEAVATEAFYNVTLPDPDWPAERVEEHLRGFNEYALASVSIHEAYPGHYVQFLHVNTTPLSMTRKMLGAGTNIEGWAHYVEQMMLDEGYRDGDPRYRLGMLHEALLRAARFIVGIELHCGDMSQAQAEEFFVREGRQTRSAGATEAARGLTDPHYLIYTLGKLMVLRLRDEYRAERGASYTLKGFHAEFLRQGFPPLPLVRERLIGARGALLDA
jgi:hypothetical protein